jgi:hypothetical protein
MNALSGIAVGSETTPEHGCGGSIKTQTEEGMIKDPMAQRAIERLQTLAKGYRLMHVDDPESLALITRADEVEHCLEILQECFQEAPRERLS